MYISKKPVNFRICTKKRKTEKMRAKTGQIRHCVKKCNFLLCKNIQRGKKTKKAKKICANEEKFTLRQKRDSSPQCICYLGPSFFFGLSFIIGTKKCFKIDIFAILHILINKNDNICSFIEEISYLSKL